MNDPVRSSAASTSPSVQTRSLTPAGAAIGQARAAARPVGIYGFWLVLSLLALTVPVGAAVIESQDTMLGNAHKILRESTDPTFRFACQIPCPIPDATLRAALDGFLVAKSLMAEMWGVDVIPELRPVDIFFEGNAICPPAEGAVGYATTYQPYGSQGRWHGKVCLFHWDRYVAGEFDTDWFTAEHAGDLERQVLILHEYGHVALFQFHHYSHEDVVIYLSNRIAGLTPLAQGACTADPLSMWSPLIYYLCTLYGMDDAALGASWRGVQQLYQSGMGYLESGLGKPRTSVSQWREQLDSVLGESTARAFLLAGWSPQLTGGRATLTAQGGIIEMADGRLRLEVPAGAVSQPTAIKLDAGNCAPSHPNLDFERVFELVSADHRSSQPRPMPQFQRPVQLRYDYSHAGLDPDIDRSRLRLYRGTHCGTPGPMTWQEVPGARLDPVRRRVHAPITSGGLFAVLPSSAAPLPTPPESRTLPRAGPWYQLASDGSGFDIQFHTEGAGLTVYWYTYRPDGTPIWYMSHGMLPGNRYQAPLIEVHRNSDGSWRRETVGSLDIRFISSTSANLTWQIGQQTGQMNDLIFLTFAHETTQQEINGLWYPPNQSGWGASVWSQGAGEAWTVYFYDAMGRPVWLAGNTDFDPWAAVRLRQNTGSCPWCPYQRPTSRSLNNWILRNYSGYGSSASVEAVISLLPPLQGDWRPGRDYFVRLSDYTAHD